MRFAPSAVLAVSRFLLFRQNLTIMLESESRSDSVLIPLQMLLYLHFYFIMRMSGTQSFLVFQKINFQRPVHPDSFPQMPSMVPFFLKEEASSFCPNR
jgi:hypothetical protein